MNNRKLLICASLFALLLNNPASAGNRPGAITFTLSDAYYYFASRRHLDNVGVPNVALAYNLNRQWGVEAGVGVFNTNFKHNGPGVHGFLYTLDGIYRFMPYNMFEPYVIAGIGITSLKPNGLQPEQSGNVNAGLGTQIFFDKSVALRVEARDVYTMNGGYNDVMLNFGVSILFGGANEVITDLKGEK